MTAKATTAIADVLHACDLTRFPTIADIGGGRGHLLRAVLDASPSATRTAVGALAAGQSRPFGRRNRLAGTR